MSGREDYLRLAAWLRDWRLDRGLSAGGVAGRFGVTGTMLLRWERGLNVPSAANLFGWLDALGLGLEVFEVEVGDGGPVVPGVRRRWVV